MSKKKAIKDKSIRDEDGEVVHGWYHWMACMKIGFWITPRM
jgi:hypothetical protein